MPRIAISDTEILNYFDTVAELRQHLKKDQFLATVREMEKGGYQLLYIEDDSAVVAVAGFRIARNLHMGKYLYIDDLVTAESQRSKGYGETLVLWLRELAINKAALICIWIPVRTGVAPINSILSRVSLSRVITLVKS